MSNRSYPENLVFGLDIGTRSVVGTVGYKPSKDRFTVVAQCTKLHETRAMMDGQIHDIGAVASTISQVRRELEKAVGKKLESVCIAAAGRVLRTAGAHAEMTFEDETVVNDEHIHSLEMLGVESAYNKMREETTDGHNFFCVAYTVIHYYLNDYMITSLADHKAVKIGVDVLATFLPDEVIDGLYSAVEKADLLVENITLEPIAAMQLAIPERFRLLNIALVDVGAGTSDICITRDGSVVAYGMIPMAGDRLTEAVAKRCLVDFATAEEIKMASSTKKKLIPYTDILGLPQKIDRNEVLAAVSADVETITDEIAAQIKKLNGDKSVSAVFVVGGGGKISGFTEGLAKKLELPKERVALRGEEVMTQVDFLQEGIVKDPLLVTPIGICLNYFEQKNSFIFVRVNNERIKLYDNGKLTIVDAALQYGFPNEKLFPARGRELTFTVNGEKRMVRGELGEAAVIHLNKKVVGMNSPIQQNDDIQIQESTVGAKASCTVGKLPEHKDTISFTVNGNKVSCPRYMTANNEMVSEFYEIQEGDVLASTEYYTMQQVLSFLDIAPTGKVYVNHLPAGPDEKVYENFSVNLELQEIEQTAKYATNEENPSETKESENIGDNDGAAAVTLADRDEEEEEPVLKKPPMVNGEEMFAQKCVVLVNNSPVALKGKRNYLLVDVLDVYPFSLSDANGRSAIVRVNGLATNFAEPIHDGDSIELSWQEK